MFCFSKLLLCETIINKNGFLNKNVILSSNAVHNQYNICNRIKSTHELIFPPIVKRQQQQRDDRYELRYVTLVGEEASCPPPLRRSSPSSARGLEGFSRLGALLLHRLGRLMIWPRSRWWHVLGPHVLPFTPSAGTTHPPMPVTFILAQINLIICRQPNPTPVHKLWEFELNIGS